MSDKVDEQEQPVSAVSAPPLQAEEERKRSEAAEELDVIRRRLLELQQVLTERFSRQSWDEYMRLRRAARSQKVE